MIDIKTKKRYVRPDEKQVKKNLESYKSDIKLDVSPEFKYQKNEETGNTSPLFDDPEFGQPLPKIVFNSMMVSDNFEVETFVDNDKFHIRFTDNNSKLQGTNLSHGYIELILDSYEDLLKLSNNVFTKNGITQTKHGLDVEKLLNQNQLYKKVATASFLVGAASLVFGLFNKNKKS